MCVERREEERKSKRDLFILSNGTHDCGSWQVQNLQDSPSRQGRVDVAT